MNAKFKPYRLINDHELRQLKQTFDEQLQRWNETYALFPLKCALSRSSMHLFTGANNNDLSLIKYCLFGELADCFNSVTEIVFIELLNQLFGTQPIAPSDDWIYPGSPSLTLTLSQANQTKNIYIPPEWVLNTLPVQKTIQNSTADLHHALAAQQLDLHVELNTLPLKLADIMRLQVGDVIQFDHPITQAARLVHQQKTICDVELGAADSYKSIQIARPS